MTKKSITKKQKYNLLNITWQEFETFCKELLLKRGIKASETRRTRDGGIDIIGFSDDPFLGGKLIVQCKKYDPKNPVSRPKITSLHGLLHHENATHAILITTSYFTKPAQDYAKDNPIKIINGSELVKIVKSTLPEYAAVAINTPVETRNKYLLKGDECLYKGLKLKAIKQYLLAIKQDKTNPTNWISLGYAYLNSIYDEKVKKHFSKKGIEDITTYLLQKSEEAFYHALACDKRCVDAYLGLKEVCVSSGRYTQDNQINYLRKAHNLEPYDIEILWEIASCYKTLADEERFQYENPRLGDQRHQLSFEERETIRKEGRKEEVKHLKEGLNNINKAIDITDKEADLHFLKGTILLRLDRRIDAEEELYTSSYLNPKLYKDFVRITLGHTTEKETIQKMMKELDYKHMRHRITDEKFFRKHKELILRLNDLKS